MKTAVASTSVDAFYRHTASGKNKTQENLICDVLRAHGKPMSLREIAASCEAITGERIDVSTVSARVNKLKADEVLELATPRKCSISGVTVNPVRLVAGQRVLF